MIDWKPIEAALVDWVLLELRTRIQPGQVLWKGQNLPQPAYPYLLLKKDSIVKTSSAPDEKRETTNLGAASGEEITIETVAIREFTLSVEARVDEENGSTDANKDADYLLSVLQSSLSKNSVQESFCLLDLVPVEEFPVVGLNQVVNDEMISRATMDIKFRVTFTTEEKTGYVDAARIQSVPVTPSGPSDVEGVDFTVAVS
jgi:hypothetical protein